MKTTLQNQINTIRKHVLLRLVSAVLIMVALPIVNIVSQISRGSESWLKAIGMNIAFYAIAAFLLFLAHRRLFLLYYGLRSVTDADEADEIAIHCTKIRYMTYRPSRHSSSTHIFAVVFTDERGKKYTYTLEDELIKNAETLDLFRNKKGLTVRLFCYKGTHIVRDLK